MEKLGVVTDASKTKTASVDKRCPDCGAKLIQDAANVDICPVCGTEPFEPKPEEYAHEED